MATAILRWGSISASPITEIKIHRSSTEGFTPNSSTLVTTLASDVQEYTDDIDTSSGASTYFYIIEAVRSGANLLTTEIPVFIGDPTIDTPEITAGSYSLNADTTVTIDAVSSEYSSNPTTELHDKTMWEFTDSNGIVVYSVESGSSLENITAQFYNYPLRIWKTNFDSERITNDSAINNSHFFVLSRLSSFRDQTIDKVFIFDKMTGEMVKELNIPYGGLSPVSISADNDNNMYIAGSSSSNEIIKMNFDGIIEWIKEFPTNYPAQKANVFNGTDVYIGMRGNSYAVYKVTTDGIITEVGSAGGNVYGLDVDASGNVYTAASTSRQSSWYVRKFNSTGEIWDHYVSSGGPEHVSYDPITDKVAVGKYTRILDGNDGTLLHEPNVSLSWEGVLMYNGILYAFHGFNEVSKYDIASKLTLWSIPSSIEIQSQVGDIDGSGLYVYGYDSSVEFNRQTASKLGDPPDLSFINGRVKYIGNKVESDWSPIYKIT